jgi:hypothetical protein
MKRARSKIFSAFHPGRTGRIPRRRGALRFGLTGIVTSANKSSGSLLDRGDTTRLIMFIFDMHEARRTESAVGINPRRIR